MELVKEIVASTAEWEHLLDLPWHLRYAAEAVLSVGLKAWLEAVQTMMRAALVLTRQRPDELLSPITLDAWEERPRTPSNAGNTQALQVTDADKIEEEIAQETLSSYR